MFAAVLAAVIFAAPCLRLGRFFVAQIRGLKVLAKASIINH